MLTETRRLEEELVTAVNEIYSQETGEEERCKLRKELHIAYLEKGLFEGYPEAYLSLDASRPWLIYWSLQALSLLGALPTEPKVIDELLQLLASFQVPIEGGFGGGVQEATGHYALLAPTYASLCAIACLGDQRGFALVNRPALKGFLKRLKQPDGSFRMHEVDGEIDTRATYCAVVAGKLTGCWDDELEAGVLEWLSRCQSFEGGFGGVPGAEAHGGYTYCALAAASLISPARTAALFDLPKLLFWLSAQQCDRVGGFRGRTHKLADGCYSFWQAACFDLLRGEFNNSQLFDAAALQNFILQACQNTRTGGLRDKPGKYEDVYHTCYCLSGLAVAQHQLPDPDFILGGPSNLLPKVDTRFNLISGKAEEMMAYYAQ